MAFRHCVHRRLRRPRAPAGAVCASVLFAALLLPAAVAAQSAGLPSAADESERTTPTGFGDIELGLTLETVKDRLLADTNFRYRGDPDVSMLNSPVETLIETEGNAFVDRGLFQFREGKLYTITILVDRSRMDHYTLYTTFVERYGEPTTLSPNEVVWEFDGIRFSLERPLTVKYIDSRVFADILRESRKAESIDQLNREFFLDQF